MLACLLNESNRIELREIPIPRLDRGDALVKMEACGILGHEVSGTIQQAPDEMKDYVPGDRVVAHHHVPCYNCFSCLRGDLTLCQQFKKTNIEPCGTAASFRVPRYNIERGALIHLPNDLSLEDGAMIEPTACCI